MKKPTKQVKRVTKVAKTTKAGAELSARNKAFNELDTLDSQISCLNNKISALQEKDDELQKELCAIQARLKGIRSEAQETWESRNHLVNRFRYTKDKLDGTYVVDVRGNNAICKLDLGESPALSTY